MSPDIRFACAVFLLDLISVWILRDTLNDFLTGNCSKTGVRNIRRTLSAGNRVTLGYIEPYIREEKEKVSFRRYRCFYIVKCFSAPAFFAAAVFFAVKGVGFFRTFLCIYACLALIPILYIGIFEWDPKNKCTVHAMKRHPKKKKKR